jgi:hypothetical protein
MGGTADLIEINLKELNNLAWVRCGEQIVKKIEIVKSLMRLPRFNVCSLLSAREPVHASSIAFSSPNCTRRVSHSQSTSHMYLHLPQPEPPTIASQQLARMHNHLSHTNGSSHAKYCPPCHNHRPHKL